MSRFLSRKAKYPTRQIAHAVCVAALGMSLLLARVQAIDTVTLKIGPGGDVGAFLFGVNISNEDTVQLELVVIDRRGSASGWAVSLAADLSLLKVGEPMVLAGQRVVAAGPLFDALQSTSLRKPRITIWADRGAGSGNYGQLLDVQIVELRPAFLVTITVGLAP